MASTLEEMIEESVSSLYFKAPGYTIDEIRSLMRQAATVEPDFGPDESFIIALGSHSGQTVIEAQWEGAQRARRRMLAALRYKDRREISEIVAASFERGNNGDDHPQQYDLICGLLLHLIELHVPKFKAKPLTRLHIVHYTYEPIGGRGYGILFTTFYK